MIRLSKLADYGIVIMTHMARGRARQHATHDIAEATQVPAAMASKILKSLVRSGLLTSNRGANGGYVMTRDPAGVTVAEVVEALEGPIALTSCTDDSDSDCGIESLCPTRTNWQRINDAIRAALAEISIGEMATAIPPAFMIDKEQGEHAEGLHRA